MSNIDRGREQDCSKCYWWYDFFCAKKDDCFGWETEKEAKEK